ncbi:MAG: hypothetical protein V2A62_05010 [Candidatus Woesearchaeota archaeon]
MIALVIALALIVMGFIVKIPHVVNKDCFDNVPQETSKQVCNQVPYQEQYTCSKTVPTEKDIPLDYTESAPWVSDSCVFATCVGVSKYVTNNDDVGGTFTVKFDMTKSDGSKLNAEVSHYIPPKSTVTFRAGDYKFGISIYTTSVTAPTKKVVVEENVTDTCSRISYKNECHSEKEVIYTKEKRSCPETRYRSLFESIGI